MEPLVQWLGGLWCYSSHCVQPSQLQVVGSAPDALCIRNILASVGVPSGATWCFRC